MSYRNCLSANVLMATVFCAISVADDGGSKSKQGGSNGAGKSLIAALRDGATIELVAVIRVGDTGEIAWKPDGSSPELSDKWPSVLRVRDDNPTHGFIFRFDGLQNGQGIGWNALLTTPLPGELLEGFVSVSGSFPEMQSTDIGVGVLDEWGPWQPVDADGSIANRVKVSGPAAALYRSINSLSVRGISKPLIGLNRQDVLQPLASLAEYEVVAVDSQGVRHRRKGVGILDDEQVPYFNLELIDLKAFEFRLRPYMQWVEFKNIPLETAVQGAEVSVSEPRAVNGEP